MTKSIPRFCVNFIRNVFHFRSNLPRTFVQVNCVVSVSCEFGQHFSISKKKNRSKQWFQFPNTETRTKQVNKALHPPGWHRRAEFPCNCSPAWTKENEPSKFGLPRCSEFVWTKSKLLKGLFSILVLIWQWFWNENGRRPNQTKFVWTPNWVRVEFVRTVVCANL